MFSGFCSVITQIFKGEYRDSRAGKEKNIIIINRDSNGTSGKKDRKSKKLQKLAEAKELEMAKELEKIKELEAKELEEIRAKEIEVEKLEELKS